MDLNVMCGVSQLSYGVCGFYILKAFKELGVNVSFFPIGPVSVQAYADQDCSFLSEFIKNSEKFNPDAPCLKIFHQNRMGEMIGRGKKFGYAFFELDPLSEPDIHHLNTLDCFISPSKWALNVAKKSGVTVEMAHVPPAADTSFIQNKKTQSETVRFLHIGKWEKRKAHEEMIEAFGEAFDIFDDVSLDMYCHNPFNSREDNEHWARLVSSSKNGHKINIKAPIERHSDVMRNYSNYDVYVSFSKAEGYDLPLIEAMACGLLCIGTYSAAHRDYLKESNSILVHPTGREIARDGKWFVSGNGEWDTFNQSDFSESLKRAFLFVKEGDIRKQEAAKELICSKSWKNTAIDILEEINR